MSNIIKISKEFHINGSGLWLGTEVTIPEESTDEQKIDAFKKEHATLVKAAQVITGISVNQTPEPYNQPPPAIQIEKSHLNIIDQMKDCKELKDLKTYKYLIKMGTEEEKVYLQMLEKLSK